MEDRNVDLLTNAQKILTQVRRVVVGKNRVLTWVLAAILAKGHILMEDIPGVGKTTMALAFSRTLGLQHSRVQFTPDVLPSDVTGYSILDQDSGKMVYQPGAVLCNLFLADELNRATSRTQSALLEAMEEGQVTVDNVTHKLPQPFGGYTAAARQSDRPLYHSAQPRLSRARGRDHYDQHAAGRGSAEVSATCPHAPRAFGDAGNGCADLCFAGDRRLHC